eukprot:gene15120-32073_t
MTRKIVNDNTDVPQETGGTLTQNTSNDNDNKDTMEEGPILTALKQRLTRSKTHQGILKWTDNITHSAPRTERKTTTETTPPGNPKIYLVQTSMFCHLDGSGAKPPITSYMGVLSRSY